MRCRIEVTEMGWRARQALRHAGGRAQPLAVLSASIYLAAGGAIIWLGRTGSARHGRAALVPALPEDGRDLTLDTARARCWQPPPREHADGAAISAGARALAAALDALGAPEGFGALLAGRPLTFPLDGAQGAARALARACAADDPDAALAAAEPLLGLGPGLTPAGDDYVGGAFFCRAVLGPREGADRWQRAAAEVRALAGTRTHPISAALLHDLVAGEGHAPLHDLAQALATGAPPAVALDAAQRLVRIGHSSGWDMLAGFLGAIPGGHGLHGLG